MYFLLFISCNISKERQNITPTTIPTNTKQVQMDVEIEKHQTLEPQKPKPEMSVQKGIIGKGTMYETEWIEYTGPKEGNSIIVEGGIHGDEVAGTMAIEALIPKIKIHSGRVVWLSQMNKPAYSQTKRFINVDLNKVFPGNTQKKEYEYSLAAELFQWVSDRNVDVVLTLHESRYLHDGSNPKTFGQTIVYGVKPVPPLLTNVISELNTEMKDPKHKFYTNYFPIATSSTEQFVENFKVQGFCAETWRGFDIETRVELQEEIILSFLHQLKIEYTISEEFKNEQ